jgi:hypothetical protein
MYMAWYDMTVDSIESTQADLSCVRFILNIVSV